MVIFDGRSKGNEDDEFQTGDADMIVAQYSVGGPGVNLYASHTMVMFEPCLSALMLDQSMHRIFRKGQEHACRYMMLYTPHTYEDMAWATVKSGKDVTADLMYRWSQGLDIPDFTFG